MGARGLVRVTVRAFIGQGQASRVVYGSGLEEVIEGLRHDLKMKTESVGDGRSACVARDRAARVLRVLDAAKVGEVN